METLEAITALSALAQGTRIETFRVLVRHEPGGLPAGILAERLAVPPNTMSAHLATLANAGLVRGARRGRQVIYRADLDRLRALILYLLKDCCGGDASLCTPIVAELATCCDIHGALP